MDQIKIGKFISEERKKKNYTQRYYVVFLVVYGLVTYIFFTLHFLKAKKGIKRYYHNLKKLNSMYHQQS